jgi:hypothetical protein
MGQKEEIVHESGEATQFNLNPDQAPCRKSRRWVMISVSVSKAETGDSIPRLSDLHT